MFCKKKKSISYCRPGSGNSIERYFACAGLLKNKNMDMKEEEKTVEECKVVKIEFRL